MWTDAVSYDKPWNLDFKILRQFGLRFLLEFTQSYCQLAGEIFMVIRQYYEH